MRPDLPFHSEIHWLRDRGITTGWPGAFGCPGYRPWAPIARNAMAAFLYRYVNGGVPQPANTCDDPRLGRNRCSASPPATALGCMISGLKERGYEFFTLDEFVR